MNLNRCRIQTEVTQMRQLHPSSVREEEGHSEN